VNDQTNVLMSLVTQIELFDPSRLLYEERWNGRGRCGKAEQVNGAIQLDRTVLTYKKVTSRDAA